MKETNWKGVTGGGKTGQVLLRLFLKYFDVRICYVPILLIVPFYFVFAHGRAASIYHYFRQRQHFGRLKSGWKTYLNHFYFGQLVVDRFAIFAGQRSKFTFQTTGDEHWDAANASAKGCVVVGSHIGNFELAGYLLGKPEKKMHCLIYGKEAEKIQKYRSRMFGENDISMIPIKEDLGHLLQLNEAIQRHEIICMTADRTTKGSRTVTAHLLGSEVHLPMGAFHIAVRHDANMLAVFMLREKNMHYHVYVRPIAADTSIRDPKGQMEQLAESYAREMEQILRQYPEQWYNFYEFWEQ
jgi:predicted LPLAT superfamily acyltransferase